MNYEEDFIEEDWLVNNRDYYGIGSSHVTQKVSEKSILEDLANFPIPEDIKYGANEVFKKIKLPTKRGRERKKMLFFCVYSAYKEKGSVINPQVLGKDMKLAPGDIAKALTTFSEVQTGYRPCGIKVLPYDIIPELCTSLHIDHVTSDVLEIAKEVIDKCPSLVEEFPYKVAGGILKYYMEINGMQIPSEDFRKVVDFSDVTIRDIHDRVTKIHNQV